jgi:hypothetical protein
MSIRTKQCEKQPLPAMFRLLRSARRTAYSRAHYVTQRSSDASTGQVRMHFYNQQYFPCPISFVELVH